MYSSFALSGALKLRCVFNTLNRYDVAALWIPKPIRAGVRRPSVIGSGMPPYGQHDAVVAVCILFKVVVGIIIINL